MPTIVSPDVLHLLGVGSDGTDAYLRRGRHLRWFPNPVLGFPRRGFLLRRRPSPPWPWSKELVALDASLSDGVASGGAWLADASGHDAGDRRLRVTSPAGPVSPTAGAVQPGTAGVVLEPLDGTRPDPCAWVALQVDAPSGSDASVTATAWSRGPGDEQAVVASVSARVHDLETWRHATHPEPAGRVLLIDGGLVDGVEVHASAGVTLTRVAWITASRYADAGGWDEVARLLLPIDGDGTTYPSQPDVDAVVDARLAAGAATGAPPWAEATWPPPPRPAAAGRAAAAARFDPHVPHLQDELTRVLATEVSDGTPQGLVEPATPPLDVDSGGTATFTTRPVPLLLGAALEFPVAHLLGVAAHDPDPPEDVPHDYCVTAWYPTAWLVTLLAPALAARFDEHPLVSALPSNARDTWLVPPLPPHDPPTSAPMFVRAASIATALVEVPLPPVAPPSDVSTALAPGRGSSPLGVDAELSWETAAPPDARQVPVVAATQVRTDPGGRVPLARTDPLSGEPVPTLSGTGRHILLDRTLRVAGRTRWDVHDLDLWGRWSAPATADLEVVDDLPPPAPTGLQADAAGPPDPSGGTVAHLEVGFDWTPANAAAAPDTVAFDVLVVAGDHPADAAATLSGADAELALDGTTPTPGATADRQPSPDGGTRYRVRLPDVPATRSGHTWTATVVVRARDDGGHMSVPVAAPADVVEEARPDVPPGLPGVQRTSWPDPEGRGWFRVTLTPPTGGRVQVLRATGARLLAAADEVRDEPDDDAYAAQLRGLAVDHPHAFSPDHPHSYDEDVTHHDVAVPGDSRDLEVLVVVPTGPTGSRAGWPDDPDAFTVVGARRRSIVATPRLTVTLDAAGAAVLTVAGPHGPGRVRAWRSDDPAALADVRRMRPLPPASPDPSGEASIVDADVAPARWYAYRAAHEAPDGRRSAPTAPAWVRTRDA